jgi:hypothetical protein
MSETKSRLSGGTNLRAPFCVRSQERPTLLPFSDHIINWVVSFESLANRVNKAEASDLPEGDVAAVEAEELEAMLEIEELACVITEMHAVDQAEVDAKKRALDALTSVLSWERESLAALRRSIERDQVEVNARLFGAPPPAPVQRLSWLSRMSRKDRPVRPTSL